MGDGSLSQFEGYGKVNIQSDEALEILMAISHTATQPSSFRSRIIRPRQMGVYERGGQICSQCEVRGLLEAMPATAACSLTGA